MRRALVIILSCTWTWLCTKPVQVCTSLIFESVYHPQLDIKWSSRLRQIRIKALHVKPALKFLNWETCLVHSCDFLTRTKCFQTNILTSFNWTSLKLTWRSRWRSTCQVWGRCVWCGPQRGRGWCGPGCLGRLLPRAMCWPSWTVTASATRVG